MAKRNIDDLDFDLDDDATPFEREERPCWLSSEVSAVDEVYETLFEFREYNARCRGAE